MSNISVDRIDRIKRYWKAAADQDHDTIGELAAKDIFRSGPLMSKIDDVHGREKYCDYVRKIQSHLTAYRNTTHNILASEDGRRGYLHCTEWDGVGGTEMEVPMVLVFDFDNTGLMTKIDIFWTNTADPDMYKGFVEFLSRFHSV